MKLREGEEGGFPGPQMRGTGSTWHLAGRPIEAFEIPSLKVETWGTRLVEAGAAAAPLFREEFCQHQSSDSVLEEVCHHAGAKAFAPQGERAEHAAIDGDYDHHAGALVRVSRAEENALQCEGGGGARSPGGELALQVTAEDGLLADAGGEGEKKIGGDLEGGVRHEVFENRVGIGMDEMADQSGGDAKNDLHNE